MWAHACGELASLPALEDKQKAFEFGTTQEELGQLDDFVSEREVLSAMLWSVASQPWGDLSHTEREKQSITLCLDYNFHLKK